MSQLVGYGPICRMHSKNSHVGGPTYDMFGGADFDFTTRESVIVIRDLNGGGRSVTNDLFNVVTSIEAQVGSLSGMTLIYRDSMGIWDQIIIDEKSGTPKIVPLNETSEEAALRKVLRPLSRKPESPA